MHSCTHALTRTVLKRAVKKVSDTISILVTSGLVSKMGINTADLLSASHTRLIWWCVLPPTHTLVEENDVTQFIIMKHLLLVSVLQIHETARLWFVTANLKVLNSDLKLRYKSLICSFRKCGRERECVCVCNISD